MSYTMTIDLTQEDKPVSMTINSDDLIKEAKPFIFSQE